MLGVIGPCCTQSLLALGQTPDLGAEGWCLQGGWCMEAVWCLCISQGEESFPQPGRIPPQSSPLVFLGSCQPKLGSFGEHTHLGWVTGMGG